MNGGEHADVWQWHMTSLKTCWKILKKAPFKAVQMFSFNVITCLQGHMCYRNSWEFHKSACTAFWPSLVFLWPSPISVKQGPWLHSSLSSHNQSSLNSQPNIQLLQHTVLVWQHM